MVILGYEPLWTFLVAKIRQIPTGGYELELMEKPKPPNRLFDSLEQAKSIVEKRYFGIMWKEKSST